MTKEIRPQLEEDLFSDPKSSVPLTEAKKKQINEVTRPQLQEDLAEVALLPTDEEVE